MDQGDQSTAAPTTRAVAADGSVVRKVLEVGGRPEFGLLDAGNQGGGLAEDMVQLVMRVGDAIAIELQDGTFREGEGLFVWCGGGGRRGGREGGGGRGEGGVGRGE